jgi:hypothetical protein
MTNSVFKLRWLMDYVVPTGGFWHTSKCLSDLRRSGLGVLGSRLGRGDPGSMPGGYCQNWCFPTSFDVFSSFLFLFVIFASFSRWMRMKCFVQAWVSRWWQWPVTHPLLARSRFADADTHASQMMCACVSTMVGPFVCCWSSPCSVLYQYLRSG